MIETLLWVIIGLQSAILLFGVFISICYIKVKRMRETEYWTDYKHNELVFRVFKWEFESQAFNGLKRGQILDVGDLNQFYRWILFKTKVNEKDKNQSR